MTSQDVDPETYYAVGTGLFEKAGELYDAFNVNVAILGGTGSMAGTDDAGSAWAASYDSRVIEVLGAVNDLTKAMENYGGVVIQAGYNHAIAEHNATPGNSGPAPTKPPEPASVAGVLSAPPSAGGPGKGLIDAIGLMQQVGVPVPDGDTDKVSTAADAWDRLATVYQTKTIVEALEVDARAFRDTHSPEVEYIVRDLEELRDATSAVLDGCAELSQSCKDYESALGDLRTQLKGILNDLAVELAVTATVAIFRRPVQVEGGIDRAKIQREWNSTSWILDVKVSNDGEGSDLPDGPFPARAFVPSSAAYEGEIIIWISNGHVSGLEYMKDLTTGRAYAAPNTSATL